MGFSNSPDPTFPHIFWWLIIFAPMLCIPCPWVCRPARSHNFLINISLWATPHRILFSFVVHNCLTCWPIDLDLICHLPCPRLSCHPEHSLLPFFSQPSFLFLTTASYSLLQLPTTSHQPGSAPCVHNLKEQKYWCLIFKSIITKFA